MGRHRLFLCLSLAATCFLSSWAQEGASPCRIGVQFHLSSADPSGETCLRHLRAFVEQGMASYGLLVGRLSDEPLERVVHYLVERDVPFLIQHAFVSVSGSVPRYYTASQLQRVQEIAGDKFLGVHWGELDSSGLKPEDYLPAPLKKSYTREEVKTAFLRYLRHSLNEFRKENPGVPIAHSSATLSHWLFAEAGVDMICSEIGENIPTINMMLASNRGTARAYRKPWMIDHSTWWAPRGHAGVQVSPREGHTPWCFFTSLLEAAMGGADYAQLEVDWAAYDKDYNLLPWGEALRHVHALATLVGSRGETLTPFAILLGHENGWPGVGWRVGDVRNAGLFDGIRHEFMQTRDADLSLKILDIFYPQFERCGWDPEYPGFLVESPFGPLDIVPDNLPAEAYERYRVLVALGYHHASQSLLETWEAYVRKGGILICADTALLDEKEQPVNARSVEPLLGCLPDFSKRKLISLYQPRSYMEAVEGLADAGERVEWQWHRLHPVKLTSGHVVARLNDVPYLVENRLGQGRVFFITAWNGVGSSNKERGPEPFLYANILYHFLHTLKDHVGIGIEFSPWTGLDYIANRKPDGSVWLLVMNHNDMDYRRDVVMRRCGELSSVRTVVQGDWKRWKEGGPVVYSKTGDGLQWSFEIFPKSFVLFALEKATPNARQ